MTEEANSGDPDSFRYRAFISYSHRDETAAARLHRRLETYRTPRGLQAVPGATRTPPRRIHPVFRDRDELAGAGQLSDAIEAALDASASLIVLCSPAAVASFWVNQEIKRFRSNHPDRPVLAFIVAGDPAADPRSASDSAAFPLQLLLNQPGDENSQLLEPLAADARPEGDGFAAAFLKLAAGILGVGFDDLRQRELHRRQRRWAVVGGASLVLSACFAGLAWQALLARNEARAAQARAELELTSERQTRDFLLSVFELADAGKSRGAKVTVREVLDRAVARIETTPFDRPAIKARFLATMGQAYDSLGINKRAALLLQQSLDNLPPDDNSDEAREQRVDSLIELADVNYSSGDYVAASNALDSVVGMVMMDEASPSQHARAAAIRGDILSFLERDAESTSAYRQALEIADNEPLWREDDALVRSRALSGLALLDQYSGDYKSADHKYALALDLLLPVFGETHPASLTTAYSRGSNAYFAGDTESARTIWSHSLDIALQLYDPLSPEVGTLKNNLGRLALETDDLAAAEPMLRDAIASDRRFRSEGFDDLAYPLNSLAMVKLAQGDKEEARQLLEEARSIADAANHPILGPVLTHIADLDCKENPSDEALTTARRGLEVSSQREDASEWRLAEARLTVGFCEAQLMQSGEANTDSETDLATINSHFTRENYFTRRAAEQSVAITKSAPKSVKP